MDTQNYPDTWTAKDKFEYWFKRANDLYATRYDPFGNEKEVEWYCNALEDYMKEYQYWREQMGTDDKEKLILADCMFVTYNPRPDTPLKVALKAVKDFVDKQKITNYIYVVEQRGTEEKNMGDFHIHILHFHKYDRASHYKRETQSSFRKTCHVDNWSCLNIKPCKTSVDITNRLEYILGKKKDCDGHNKTEKQATDKIYRQKYMLKDYYTDDYTVWEKYR